MRAAGELITPKQTTKAIRDCTVGVQSYWVSELRRGQRPLRDRYAFRRSDRCGDDYRNS